MFNLIFLYKINIQTKVQIAKLPPLVTKKNSKYCPFDEDHTRHTFSYTL